MPDSTVDLDLRGIRLRARLSGPENGKPCLLLHGWLDTGASFDRLVPHLHEAGLRTIALDLRGHGDSSWVGAGGFYHFVEYLADIDAALDALELAPPMGPDKVLHQVHLIGHSMGASLALLYAAIRPTRVSQVSLLDGIPFLVKAAEVPARLVEYLDDLKTLPRTRRRVVSIQHAVERLWKVSPLLKEDAAYLLAQAGTSPDPGQENKLAWKWDPWLRAHSPMPFTDQVIDELIPLIRARVLIIRAGNTWLPDEAELRLRFSKLKSPLTVETIPDTSHHLHIEAASETAAMILRSLQG